MDTTTLRLSVTAPDDIAGECAAVLARARQQLPAGADAEVQEEHPDAHAWAEALDQAGPHADLSWLRRHLDAAPDPDHPDAAFLRGYLASQVAS